MNLKILIPYRVFIEQLAVKRLVVNTPAGELGILPHRLDCVAALAPGICMYESSSGQENYIAIDEGIMVKVGESVSLSVRNAIGGLDLGLLKAGVERDFVGHDEQDQQLKDVLTKLESSFLRRFAGLHHE